MTRPRFVVWSAAALGAGLVLSGCAAAVVAGAGAASMAALQDKTIGESVDDTSIWNEIRSRFVAARGMTLNGVDVEVSQRFVLLSGVAPTEADRAEAQRIAESIDRVAGVANEILIGPPRSAAQAAADELITAAVRTRLAASESVRSINFNIETHQGVVYLLGIARDQIELERAVEETRVVRGVQKVVSYVRVAPARAPAPGQSAASVEFASPEADQPAFTPSTTPQQPLAPEQAPAPVFVPGAPATPIGPPTRDPAFGPTRETPPPALPQR